MKNAPHSHGSSLAICYCANFIDRTDCEHGYVQSEGLPRKPCPWPGCKAGIDLGVSGELRIPVRTPLLRVASIATVSNAMPAAEVRRYRRVCFGTEEPYVYEWEPIS